MEDSVIHRLLETEPDWDKWEGQLQEAFAIQTLQEWICSENFKERATYFEIEKETTLGRRFIKYQTEDQFWKENEYKRLKKLLQSVYSFWKEQDWVYEETTRNGRPRRAEYSREVISKALKYSHLPFYAKGGGEDTMYRSEYWSKSILGELSVQSWVRLVVLKENVFQHLYTNLGAEFFSGCTREEVAEKLHLPKPFVNELCRWLQRGGEWDIKQSKRNGERRRVMQHNPICQKP
jgi:hypothetical protein